jgi:DNA-binding XRE family transcriptional regulator
MKQYQTLGELLIDYRTLHKVSQSDLAAKLDVDIRTVIRWEKDETLIKAEKEKDLVEQTFIPYQVIRNLNAAVPIPIFYDFKIRKYSMTEISVGLPDADAFKAHLDAVSPRIHFIRSDSEKDIEHILCYHRYLYKLEKPANKRLIVEASKRLPGLNLIMYDNTGYYAGHCVVFPVRNSVYEQLRDRKMNEDEIDETDFINYRTESIPVFYAWSIYADCNENIHFMMNSLLSFLKDRKNYIYSSLIVRPDALELMLSFGLKKVWEDKEYDSEHGKEFKPVFVEGILSGLT